MFTSKIRLATVLLSLHAVNSYILLTANLDDMHSLAKQIAESPVANQINDLIRRAATIMTETGVHSKNSSRKAQMRSDYQLDQEQPKTDVRKPQVIEGQPQRNGDQDTVEKTDQKQPEKEKTDQKQPDIEETDQKQPDIEKTDQIQPDIEETDQIQPEKEKPDQNSAERQKVADNTDTASENEKQNIEVWKPDEKALAAELNANTSDSSSELSEETNRKKLHHSSRRGVGFADLGRNASYYLNSIKKIFENI